MITESEKIYPVIKKYLDGKSVIDIGCGAKKIISDAIGIDTVSGAANIVINPADIYVLQNANKIPKADVVFSSHALEHLCYPELALQSWAKLLKNLEGLIILYLPDERYYDNRANIYHVQSWSLESFLEWIEPFHFFEIIESGIHTGMIDGHGCYSFYVVMKKRN